MRTCITQTAHRPQTKAMTDKLADALVSTCIVATPALIIVTMCVAAWAVLRNLSF